MGRTSDARERLIEAATDLIYSSGYQGTGVDELCQRAGVRKGSFYYFFPSKQDLAVAALDRFFARGSESLIEPTLGSDLPPLERILSFFEAMAAGAEQMQTATGVCGGCMFGNIAAEMASRDPLLRSKVQEVLGTITSYFERVLKEAVKSGEVSGIDPATNARALVAYMEGVLLLGKTMADASVMRSLVHHALALATTPKPPKRSSRAKASAR